MDDNSRLDCVDMNLASCEEKIKKQAERIKELEALLKEKTIALSNELDDCKPYLSAKQQVKRIEELGEIVNRAIDGIDVLSVLDNWPEGQMKKDVMAIRRCLENTQNPPKPNSQTDNPKGIIYPQ